MAIPLIVGLLALKATPLALYRLWQKGGDPYAAGKQLVIDMKTMAQFGADATNLTLAINQLRNVTTPAKLAGAITDIETALTYVPDAMRAGMNKMGSFDTRIEKSIKEAVLAFAREKCLGEFEEEEPETIMIRSYVGLYLLGRYNVPLDLTEQETVLQNLVTIHKETETLRHEEIAEVVISNMPHTASMLVDTLGQLPELRHFSVEDDEISFAEYIVHALTGEKTNSLMFDDPQKDIIKRFTSNHRVWK